MCLYICGGTLTLYTYTDICVYACMLLYVYGLTGYIGMHVSVYVPLCIYLLATVSCAGMYM